MDSTTRRLVARALSEAAALLTGALDFDWKAASPEEFKQAVQDKTLTPDDLYQASRICREYDWEAAGVESTGVNKELAEAFSSGDLPLEDYVEAAVLADQAATTKFISFWDRLARKELDDLEYPRNLEYYFDKLIDRLETDSTAVQERLWTILEEVGYLNIENVTRSMMEEAATNPSLYSVKINKDSKKPPPYSVLYENIGYIAKSIQVEDTELREYVGDMSEDSFYEAAKELSKTEPKVMFEDRYLTSSDFVGAVKYRLMDPEDWFAELVVKVDALKEELDRLIKNKPNSAESLPRETVLVVTKEDLREIGAAEGRIFEEAPLKLIKLLPEDLAYETSKMKHCVGNTDMRYKSALARGLVEIWSLRDRNDIPVFTLEVDVDFNKRKGKAIKQLKGKANRTPGFASTKTTAIFFPEEVKLWNFILEKLGVDPKQVADFPACRLPAENNVSAVYSFDEPYRATK